MNEKWMPGPWVFSEPIGAEHAEVRDKNGRRIAVVIGGYPRRTKTEDANAYLLAAAPDLYAALKDLYDVLYAATDGDRVWTMDKQQAARDALAKARGEA